MPKPQAKASRKARATAALRHQVTADEVFEDLPAEYVKLKGDAKIKLALELMPYLIPKKKAVDHTGTIQTDIKVIIGHWGAGG